jgi:hypothetical protein
MQTATNTGIGMANFIARMISPRPNVRTVINLGIGMDNCIVGIYPLLNMQAVANFGFGMDKCIARIINPLPNAQMVENNGIYMVNLLNKTKIESYFFCLSYGMWRIKK